MSADTLRGQRGVVDGHLVDHAVEGVRRFDHLRSKQQRCVDRWQRSRRGRRAGYTVDGEREARSVVDGRDVSEGRTWWKRDGCPLVGAADIALEVEGAVVDEDGVPDGGISKLTREDMGKACRVRHREPKLDLCPKYEGRIHARSLALYRILSGR